MCLECYKFPRNPSSRRPSDNQMKGMTMKKTSVILLVVLLTLDGGHSQGFINLNFESANVSGYSPNSSIPIADGLPGWSASLFNSGTTNTLTQIVYDGISLGGPGVSVIDTNAPAFGPLQGKYSAFLFGGGTSGNLLSASISQTGVVPVGTESLMLDAYVYGASFSVTLGEPNHYHDSLGSIF